MIGEKVLQGKGLEPYIFIVVAVIGVGTAIRIVHDIRLSHSNLELVEMRKRELEAKGISRPSGTA